MLPSYHKLLRDPLTLRLGMNIWPPYWGAGIVVQYIHPEFRQVRVALKDRILNRNYVGTHFGGSLFAMTDPFFMLMVMRSLDRTYLVWDKAAQITFIKPGKGTLIADMRVTAEDIEDIRQRTAEGQKYEREFSAEVRNQSGELVAKVIRTVYIRLKPEYRPQMQA